MVTKKQRKEGWEKTLAYMTKGYDNSSAQIYGSGICNCIWTLHMMHRLERIVARSMQKQLYKYFKPRKAVDEAAYFWSRTDKDRGLRSVSYKERATAIGFLIAMNS
jgi:hypothetical protein